MTKTVLVTGANRGIGLEIVRQLAARNSTVILACRNAELGRKAAASLQGNVEVLSLDVTSPESIDAAVKLLGTKHDRLDVLINNAGVIHDGDNDITTMDADLVRRTMETNTLGALRVSQAFLPLLREGRQPRIINLSSGGGQLSDGIGGWAPAYCISKTALNGVTSALAGALPEFAVNSVCPGWVRTDMGGASAPRSVEQGADTPVWLALDAPQNLTGKFLRDRKEIPW
jgi:NAD(P)-dependent dehydrogenase (short-subunit alcohol dehydrogenase family)